MMVASNTALGAVFGVLMVVLVAGSLAYRLSVRRPVQGWA
jgi:hypothetical protein